MKLTTYARNQLRPAEFAVPKTRAYPISDESHARNALSRVSQFGSSQEQARVRSAVHHKFPKIGAQPRTRKPAQSGKSKSIGHRIVALGRRISPGTEPIKLQNDMSQGRGHSSLLGMPAQNSPGAFNFRPADTLLKATSATASTTKIRVRERE